MSEASQPDRSVIDENEISTTIKSLVEQNKDLQDTVSQLVDKVDQLSQSVPRMIGKQTEVILNTVAFMQPSQAVVNSGLAKLASDFDQIEAEVSDPARGRKRRRSEETFRQEAPPQLNLANLPQTGVYSYFWGNMHRSLPEDFVVPTELTCHQLWLRWNFPSAENGTPAFKHVRSSDLGTSKKIKRWADIRFTMKIVQKQIAMRGLWKENATLEEVDNMFMAVRDYFLYPEKGNVTKKRNKFDIKWSTVCRYERDRMREQRMQVKKEEDMQEMVRKVIGKSHGDDLDDGESDSKSI